MDEVNFIRNVRDPLLSRRIQQNYHTSALVRASYESVSLIRDLITGSSCTLRFCGCTLEPSFETVDFLLEGGAVIGKQISPSLHRLLAVSKNSASWLGPALFHRRMLKAHDVPKNKRL